jgi:hypothetical protein
MDHMHLQQRAKKHQRGFEEEEEVNNITSKSGSNNNTMTDTIELDMAEFRKPGILHLLFT